MSFGEAGGDVPVGADAAAAAAADGIHPYPAASGGADHHADDGAGAGHGRGSAAIGSPAGSAAAGGSTHGSATAATRRSSQQWEEGCNEGAGYPGRLAEHDNEDDFEELLRAAWEGLHPDVRSRKALVPKLSQNVSSRGSQL